MTEHQKLPSPAGSAPVVSDAIGRRSAARTSPAVDALMALQRSAGNSATSWWLAQPLDAQPRSVQREVVTTIPEVTIYGEAPVGGGTVTVDN